RDRSVQCAGDGLRAGGNREGNEDSKDNELPKGHLDHVLLHAFLLDSVCGNLRRAARGVKMLSAEMIHAAYRCPACRADLDASSASLRCAHCGAVYPIENQIADFAGGAYYDNFTDPTELAPDT